MSNTTKIAALESLLARVKRNASLPRVNGSAPAFSAPAPASDVAAPGLEAMNADLDDLLDEPVLAQPGVEVAASAVPAARAPMETFAGDDIFDDDEIVELDDDDGIEILEESQIELEVVEEEEEEFEVAVSPEPPRVEQAAPSAELDPVFDDLDGFDEPAAAASAPAEIEVSYAAPAVGQSADLDEAPAAFEASASQAAPAAFEAQPALEAAVGARAEESLEDVSAGSPVEESPGFEVEAPAASSVEVSRASLGGQDSLSGQGSDAFDDLDFDEEAEADVSSVQPAIKREYPEHSSVQASSPADVEPDIEFDLVGQSPEPPASSPRQRPPQSMDEALQSAAEQMSPVTPPPESGAQPASQRDAMDQGLLEEALMLESSVGHDVPESDDIDDLLGAEVEIPTLKQRGRPEMPTMEQLGQTVDLEAPLGGPDQLELDPLASAEVAQSQGARVIMTPAAPADDLEMPLPSRPSGAFDINLKPPPEVGAEFAELRAKQSVREERRSAPHHQRVEQTQPLPEVADVSEPLPAAMQAAVAAGGAPTTLERPPVVASDLVVERNEPDAARGPASFSAWLDASLSLLRD